MLGDVYLKSGEHAKAIAVYSSAAEIYFREGLPLKAVAICRQILKHKPDEIAVIRRLVDFYKFLELEDEALAHERMLELHTSGRE